MFRPLRRGDESGAELPRGFDHVGLLVDEPHVPAGLLFIDSFVDLRSVFSRELTHSPNRLPCDFAGAAQEGTCKRVTLHFLVYDRP